MVKTRLQYKKETDETVNAANILLQMSRKTEPQYKRKQGFRIFKKFVKTCNKHYIKWMSKDNLDEMIASIKELVISMGVTETEVELMLKPLEYNLPVKSSSDNTTIVAGKTVSLLDLSNNQDEPEEIRLEIKYPVVNLVEDPDELSNPPNTPKQETRKDPWENTYSYTLQEFKDWYGNEYGILIWELTGINDLKQELNTLTKTIKSLEQKVSSLLDGATADAHPRCVSKAAPKKSVPRGGGGFW
jgi:hypothetical protein